MKVLQPPYWYVKKVLKITITCLTQIAYVPNNEDKDLHLDCHLGEYDSEMENWRLFNLLTIYNNRVCCHTLSSWVCHSNLISAIVHYRLDGVMNQSGCGGRSFKATVGDDDVICVVH